MNSENTRIRWETRNFFMGLNLMENIIQNVCRNFKVPCNSVFQKTLGIFLTGSKFHEIILFFIDPKGPNNIL